MDDGKRKIAELEARLKVLERENAMLAERAELAWQQIEPMLQNLPDLVWITTLEGKILYSNQAAVNLFQINTKSAKPIRIEKLMPAHIALRCRQERIPQAIEKGAWLGESCLMTSSKEVVPTLQTIIAPKNDRGDVEKIFWIERDLRDLRRLEEQFVQAQKMDALGAMVGGVAHDFNNLLAGIMGNLFLLLRQAEAGPQQDRLKAVQKMCQKAAGMVAQLLIFARKDAATLTSLNLKAFMADFGRMYQVLIPENISFELGEIADDLAVLTDLPQFQQIMVNLLTNARDALTGCINPTIGVTIEEFDADEEFLSRHQTIKQSRLVRISVIDNGCGIPLELQAKIFDPFFTTKQHSKAAGLGLAMVYAAIRRQQGTIEVVSNVGQGTIVRLYLPRVQAEATLPSQADDAGLIYGQGELLILADDDDFIRDSHKDALIQLGYRVLPVADGQQAVDTLREFPQAAMAICDIVMPNLDGVEAGRQMRKIVANLPLLYMSGYVDKTRNYGSLPPGAEVLGKPASIEQLSQKVAQLLHRR